MNKTTAALKLAEEALNAMLTHMGMDEDEWTKPTFDQSRKTLAAIREVLAEPVKQEPVNYLIDALKTAKWMLERDYIDQQKMKVIEQCDDAIEKATGGGND